MTDVSPGSGLKLLFAGTPGFAAEHLLALAESHHELVAVITQPDKPGKRGKQPIASATKQVALDYGLPVLQPARLRRDDIAHLQVDLMVVVAYGQILRSDVLAHPRQGCINVHGSLLPRWRGAAPIQRAILAGDTETGICIIQMDAGLDTGDLLVCESLKIEPRETSASLTARLSKLGQATLLKAIDQIARGQAQPQPQPIGATYAHKIEKAEARIDWSMTATEIDRQVRGFNPEPIAFAELDDLRVKVWATEPEQASHQHPPGEILAVTKRGVQVACGSGSLWLTTLQIPLGKGSLLSGADIMNARRSLFAPGKKLR